jgi:hypothetical protein
LKGEYYFGHIRNTPLNSNALFSLEELQSVIFTGILNPGNKSVRNLSESFKIKENYLLMTHFIDEGRKVELIYPTNSLYLSKITVTDYPGDIFADATLSRTVDKLDKIEGSVVLKSNRYDVSLSFDRIENKPFSKTAFNLGRNYKKLEYLF